MNFVELRGGVLQYFFLSIHDKGDRGEFFVEEEDYNIKPPFARLERLWHFIPIYWNIENALGCLSRARVRFGAGTLPLLLERTCPSHYTGLIKVGLIKAVVATHIFHVLSIEFGGFRVILLSSRCSIALWI